MEVSGRISESTEQGTGDNLDLLCELCEDDDVQTKAEGFCRECEQYICNICFKHHLRAKTCRNHVLIVIYKSFTPTQRSVINVETCKQHANENVKYYCRKHEVVGCGDCMIPGHSTCKPESIKDLSKDFQHNETFKSLMKKLEIILSANKENDKKVRESKTASIYMLEKALKDIKSFRTEINTYLDKAESNIIKEAKDIERKNDKLVTKLEQDCKQLHSKIMEVSQKLDKELYQDSALFILTVDCKPSVLHIEQEVSRIQRENDIRTFEFMPDKQLQDIITSIEKLGSLIENKSQSRTKPDTARLTKEVDTEALASQKKRTEPVQEKENKAQEPAKRVAFGARVRPILNYVRSGFVRHNGRPGTVSAVNSDGRVDVKWDADTGYNDRCCTIGHNVELV